MKKKYIAPQVTIECRFAEVLEISTNSVGVGGSVTGQDDTGWEFGGTPGEDDGPVTPTAKKFNLWDDWD